MGNVAPIIAVTGTRREGNILAGLSTSVIAGGGDPALLEAQLAQAVKGAAAIVSFGMAGALDPELKIGRVIIGTRLTGSWEGDCDRKWAEVLAARIPGAKLGPCYADGRLISDASEKREIGRSTGAIAADMESHIAARIAADAGVPFAILRCISDEVDAGLPPAIALAMRPGGGLSLGAMLGSIIQNPGQFPALFRTLTRFRVAYTALQFGVGDAGVRLAFDRR
jgi:adenosylhomocysteine nucleosidase